MEQTKALNALEPFLALTDSATSPRTAADLVSRATSNPNTFLFTELLQSTQIRTLSQSPDFAPHHSLLQIFSYGTYADYQSRRQQQQASLPDLNEAQTRKLRQLSLLTLARERANLAYPALQSALSLPDGPALEALVISAVYAGLLSATLDPARQHVHVSALSPLRDLRPCAVPVMASALRAWSTRCTDTLADIESQMAGIRAAAVRRQREAAARDQAFGRLVDDAKKKSGGGDGPGEGTTSIGDRTRRPGAAASGGARGGPQGRGRAINKRASNVMEQATDVDDEAMDVDVEEEDQKRASRRKLQS